MNDPQFKLFYSSLQSLRVQGKPLAVATLVHTLGSAPQEAGARAIISEKGLEFGTVGGGKIEARVIETAKDLLKDPLRKNGFFQWNLQKDIGMTCGGVASFFIEIFRSESPWNIAVFGAGHVAQELIPLLLNLNCQVTCTDPRPEWIAKLPEHPRLKTICTSDMPNILESLEPETFIVTLTMGHSTDLPILVRAAQKYSFPYIGNMGSELKSRVLKNDLRKAGVSETWIARLFCPIGEDFGSHSPIEISFSIIAQLLRERDRYWNTARKE